MLKTASALLAAAALLCGLGALLHWPTTRAGLAFSAGPLFFGWLALAVRPLRRELADTIAFLMREPR